MRKDKLSCLYGLLLFFQIIFQIIFLSYTTPLSKPAYGRSLTSSPCSNLKFLKGLCITLPTGRQVNHPENPHSSDFHGGSVYFIDFSSYLFIKCFYRMIEMDMALQSSLVSSNRDEMVHNIHGHWLALDINLLTKQSPYNKILLDTVLSFLRSKELKYIEIMHLGKRIAYYSKENFIEAINYIKSNYEEFSVKSHTIKNNSYQYGEADLLHKNHTFSQEELLFWDPLAQIVFAIPTQSLPKKSILEKIKWSKTRSKKEVKNVLRFAPVGFAALAIILGQIKQMDDPQHISESKFRQKTDFGTYYAYTLEHKDLPNGLKILHLSDLHLGVDRPENLRHLERLAEEMDSVDFVLLT
jgi:hypothetical protein